MPIWIAYVRKDSAKGYEMTVGADLRGLQERFKSIGVMPAPSGFDAADWYASTKTLAKFSGQAAQDWRDGDSIQAMATFEVVVENSNKFVKKVNSALDLNIRRS